MKALLWKDYRVNRVVVIAGLVLLVGPPIAGALVNLNHHRQFGMYAWPWGETFADAAIVSLLLSLITFVVLGGNAVAGERADRSAEFLAYLPPSRRTVITSKAVLAVGVMLCIWLLNLTVMYAIAPALGLTQPSNNMSSGIVGLLAVTSAIVFGAAWLASCTLDSPTYAVCVGFIAPCLVGAVLGLVEYHFELEDFNFRAWYGGVCTTLGILCFAGGIACYIRRVEP